jgi:hypothetical protein
MDGGGVGWTAMDGVGGGWTAAVSDGRRRCGMDGVVCRLVLDFRVQTGEPGHVSTDGISCRCAGEGEGVGGGGEGDGLLLRSSLGQDDIEIYQEVQRYVHIYTLTLFWS